MFNAIKKILGLGPKINMKEMIGKGALILDVRSKEEYAGGHVKGSVNVPLNQLPAYLKKMKSKDQVIITCCASGMRSGVAKNMLKEQGFTHVHNGGSWLSVNNCL